jgi:UDP-glucose 4-epimerase
MRILVTGGAGFIGSHLVDALLARQDQVAVLDNLSSGKLSNLDNAVRNRDFRFVEGDLKKSSEWKNVLRKAELVFHLAANPEVRSGETDPKVHFEENLVATYQLLEAMRTSGGGKMMVFASTSTVYGEASILPTPEDYGPLLPISTYGASKLGCEALIASYAHTFGFRGLVFRLGNIVGSRGQHGIVIDLIKKLRSNKNSLEILGDGSQTKSYLHISDCVQATLFATQEFLRSKSRIEVYNLSSKDQVGVGRIADIVKGEMGLSAVPARFTGGVDGGRGWLGDVKVMHLSVERLEKLGWNSKHNSEQAVRLAAQELLRESSH